MRVIQEGEPRGGLHCCSSSDIYVTSHAYTDKRGTPMSAHVDTYLMSAHVRGHQTVVPFMYLMLH